MFFGFAFCIAYIMLLVLIGSLCVNANILVVSAILLVVTLVFLIGVDRYVYYNQEKLFKKIV